MLNHSFIWKQTIIKHPLYMPSTIVYYRDTEAKKLKKFPPRIIYIWGGADKADDKHKLYMCYNIRVI